MSSATARHIFGYLFHMRRTCVIAARLDNLGKGEKLQLGIFFKEERDIRQQLAIWQRNTARGSAETRLSRLIPRLVGLHQTLLANSQTAEMLLAHNLTEIARFAAKR